MTTYTTKQGDTWDLIAFRLTGNTDQIVRLMQANPEHQTTFIFEAGVVLNVPELNSVTDVYILPPWKRA